MKDSLGTRLKTYYEDRTRYSLPRRTYTIIRIDGKAFHTYTKGLQRPIDSDLISDMDETASYLCKNIQGVRFGYVQSDEISLLLTDFDDLGTHMWFDGNIQKICSVSASMATSIFNKLRYKRYLQNKIDIETKRMSDKRYEKEPSLAMFDARVFQIPSSIEVENYFIWRQQDATRNSISSSAQSLYSHKELNGKKSDDLQEMIFQKGINWNNYSSREKRGGFIDKVTFVNGKQVNIIPKEILNTDSVRKNWIPVDCPVFTQNRMFLRTRIQNHHEE